MKLLNKLKKLYCQLTGKTYVSYDYDEWKKAREFQNKRNADAAKLEAEKNGHFDGPDIANLYKEVNVDKFKPENLADTEEQLSSEHYEDVSDWEYDENFYLKTPKKIDFDFDVTTLPSYDENWKKDILTDEEINEIKAYDKNIYDWIRYTWSTDYDKDIIARKDRKQHLKQWMKEHKRECEEVQKFISAYNDTLTQPKLNASIGYYIDYPGELNYGLYRKFPFCTIEELSNQLQEYKKQYTLNYETLHDDLVLPKLMINIFNKKTSRFKVVDDKICKAFGRKVHMKRLTKQNKKSK